MTDPTEPTAPDTEGQDDDADACDIDADLVELFEVLEFTGAAS